MKRLLSAFIVLLGLGAAAFWLLRPEADVQTSIRLSEAMRTDTTGYARAVEARTFTFPDDHGPHEAFAIEWWYYTGNVETAEGRRFGFQFTIFRNSLTPPLRTVALADSGSTWDTNQLYFAHLAVSDAEHAQFYHAERFSRGSAGLAGAQADPFRVWIEDWTMTADGAMPRMHLQAEDADFAIDLRLDPAKPFVLQGDEGLSQKGNAPGQASYYYAFTRLATTGTIRLGDEMFDVTGLAWKDREWSTSTLSDDQVGWDWFALQLDNGYDLMYYQLRTTNGNSAAQSSGSIIAPDGQKTHLTLSEVNLVPTQTWTNPQGDATYPTHWRLSIPARNIDVTVSPVFPDQEMRDTAVRYWEGAIDVTGTWEGTLIQGRGYLEMTGYADIANRGDGSSSATAAS